jgi:hypothetical protein
MNSYVDRTRLVLLCVDIGIALRGECYLSTESWELQTQGLGNELIENSVVLKRFGSIRKRQRLGGLLSYYYRAA